MQDQNYTTTILVEKTPEQVFNAINNVRGWWSEAIEGATNKPHSIFKYHYKDVHICTMKMIAFIPCKKVVWLVTDNYFNFTKDDSEWVGTKVSFEISQHNDKTMVLFTHIGLTASYECYNICQDAWGNYINGSLKSLIETGNGKPNPYEPAVKSAAALKLGKQENE